MICSLGTLWGRASSVAVLHHHSAATLMTQNECVLRNMHWEDGRPVSSVGYGRTVDTTTCLHATTLLNDLFKFFKDFLLFNLDRLPSGSGFLVILLKSRALLADLGQTHVGALFEQPVGCRLAPR